jgi:CRISPR/Cas system-associated endoribonuclease Cas2
MIVNQRIQCSAFIGSLRRDELNSLLVDLKNLGKDLVENVQLYPVCDTVSREEEKDKVAYF